MTINILDYLHDSSLKNPTQVAFSDLRMSINYNDLYNISKKIGTYLAVHMSINSPVAVLIDRNIQSIISFLGIAVAGGCYIPLDPEMTSQRLNLILQELNPQYIVEISGNGKVLENSSYEDRIIPYETIISTPINEEIIINRQSQHIDTDPLYILFTSGSTGIPKGVTISHRGVIDLVEQFAETFPFNSNDIIGNQAPFDFDVSVKDIYMTLKMGCSCEILPKNLFSTPFKLIQYLNERRITVGIWAVSVLTIIAGFKTFSTISPLYLKLVMFSGEVLPVKVLNYWKSYLPQIQYVNLYVPTEITCNCTYYIVDRPFNEADVLPIGKPFKNTRILLLNEHQQEILEKDCKGEICVAGSSLSLGYYHNPEKTTQVFIQNPLNSNYSEKIYCTGDLGKYNKYGELIFLSRKDFQIKHMGHRIELGEIEAAVNSLPFISNACCVFDQAVDKIVLFYQSQSECNKEIIISLKALLPKYMWPNRSVFLTDLPLNKNGKVDRKYLKLKYCEDKEQNNGSTL